MIIVHLYHTFFETLFTCSDTSKFELLINDLHLIILGGSFYTPRRKQLAGRCQKNAATCDDSPVYVII